MRDALHPPPTIETEAHKRLSFVLRNAAETAGLAIVRGPVGVGKSYALRDLASEYRAEGEDVILISARPEIEGSITGFVNDVLSLYNIREMRRQSAIECLQGLLLHRQSRVGGMRTLLVVDESQGLKINILEMLRGLYDRGDRWRMGDDYAPAFGLVLVGNNTFLARTGRVRGADYGPLMDRVSLNVSLHRPDEAECRRFARALCPADAEAAAALTEFGASQGSLRAMEKVFVQARRLAGADGVGVEDVRRAVKLARGKVL